ncbi:TIGR04388 family protein [Leptospira sp. mild_001]|uniref:TIGR04388 family protein n=1 Tax=Leptospira sp. mild_001 TaxID=2838238 RepID=UPI001E3F6274|nr:TIGR04388 family protein [Leptospira sp. mild_001]
MNVNANFTNKLGLGLDYNFKSGDYTANASYDFDKVGGKDWAKQGHLESAILCYDNGGENT